MGWVIEWAVKILNRSFALFSSSYQNCGGVSNCNVLNFLPLITASNYFMLSFLPLICMTSYFVLN
jgi:hypothetical protein